MTAPPATASAPAVRSRPARDVAANAAAAAFAAFSASDASDGAAFATRRSSPTRGPCGGGFAGAVRRDASRCCASGFFADELPSWPGSGFPKRVSASVAVFFFACVDKDR